jgi:predicted phage terminase large subunit-like protein
VSKFDEIIQSWDLAFKDLKTSDYVAGGLWARRAANKYLLHQIHDRLSFPKTVQAVRDMSRNWPAAGAKLIEDRANGPAVIQTLRDEIPGIIEIDPQGGKVARCQAVSPTIEAGNVFLPHPRLAHWVDGFINECASFPTGAHDDQVDAMSQAIIRLGHFSNRGAYDLYREAALAKQNPTNEHFCGHNSLNVYSHMPVVKPLPARPWRL